MHPPDSEIFSWEQAQVFTHMLSTSGLPKWTDTKPEKYDAWFDRINPAYLNRALYLHGFVSAINQLGTTPGELRLTHEPLHPLSAAQHEAEMAARLSKFGAVKYAKDHGLSFVSRALLDTYNPAADLFASAKLPPDVDDLLLFDPATGFIMWPEKDRIRNFWLGNQREMAEIAMAPEPIRKALVQGPDDYFRLGNALFYRVVGPRLRKRRLIVADEAAIPTFTVNSQEELEDLADDLKQACARSPFETIVVFRGQTGEYLLPDRSELAHAGICPFANIRDHSVVPSLYRKYDSHLGDPKQFREFIKHLLDWKLYTSLIFGDPAKCYTLAGEPYVPKKVPPTAHSQMAMMMGGLGGPRMFEDTRPYFQYTITDEAGNVIDEYIRTHRPGQDAARSHLVLQHYGAPTPFVDVTHDIKVAEWFALNRLHIGPDGISSTEPVSLESGTPVIYAMLLLDGLTPFANTEEMVAPEEALRPHRQACAVLGGAGNLYRNAISRFVGAKIKFGPDFVPNGVHTAEYLFPSTEEDPMLAKLVRSYRRPKDLKSPFPVYSLAKK